jgi:hypothetical protein
LAQDALSFLRDAVCTVVEDAKPEVVSFSVVLPTVIVLA